VVLTRPHLIPLSAADAPVLAGMIAICGEHAHRVHRLDHWYPTSSLDAFTRRFEPADLYGFATGTALEGAIAISLEPLPYYDEAAPFTPADRPAYLHLLAVMPFAQGGGLGRSAMAEVERLARELGADALRFDAATANTPAVGFYRRMGYDEVGVLPVRDVTVTCFERFL
jgi:ribosomal protein S18 acetylase RimI-like enzyme